MTKAEYLKKAIEYKAVLEKIAKLSISEIEQEEDKYSKEMPYVIGFARARALARIALEHNVLDES